MELANFYERFCDEAFDKNGVLKYFTPIVPEGFNFAYDVVDEIARVEPNRRCLVWCNEKGEERLFTYGEMRELSDRAANLFAANGVKKGDSVMLVLKRHYQFWYALMGLHKLGAVGIPATNLLTVKDFLYRFGAAGISCVLATTDGSVQETMEEAMGEYGGIKARFSVKGKRDGWVDFDQELLKQPGSFARASNSAEDPLLLYFTSGTTGQPKMVCHDHSYPIAHIITAKYWQNVEPDGLHLTVSETGWAKSVWGKLYGQWLMAAAVFVYDFDKFDAPVLLKMMEKYGVTSFCAPPTIYRFLIKGGMEKGSFGMVRYAVTAGEALNPEVYNRFEELTGLRLMEAFGQTETTVLTLNLVGSTPKVGSMGKPSPLYSIALLDEEGNEVAPGEVGELCVRIPEGKKQNGVY
ncbi:MAG: AMP-binding protein, partial [Oscillospiraceae bacterium]|nr:AMP-binding protein [Oscillospiraceae bacterium]